MNPPFDVEAFARQASGPSSQRKFSPDAPTQRPPAAGGVPDLGEMREQQITLTNEVELEKARPQSSMRSEPPPGNAQRAVDRRRARAELPDRPGRGRLEPRPEPAPHEHRGRRARAPSGSRRAPEITERTIEDPVAEMRERFSLGDYTGALEMSELMLAEEPGNLEAAECGENCRSVLEQMYAARLGPLDRVPMVVVPRTQMRWLSIDHRAGFILSLIDGSSSVEMILDVCGMPKLDALRILHELVQQKIVAFR